MGPFVRSAILGLTVVSLARAQIPEGFEVVDVVSGPILYSRARMNNCGEIVFSEGYVCDNWAEILLYDNGRLIQITDNYVTDVLPDINDHGAIVWTGDFDALASRGTIIMRDGGRTLYLGEGSVPSINNLGHVAWDLFDAEPCDSPSAILFYNGSTVETIIDDGLSNQSVRLNDNDQMVWTRYDFSSCGGPGDWSSEIMFYSQGMITVLPSALTTPQLPDLNNPGEAAWGDFDALEFWNGDETVLLTNGHLPALNNAGDVAFSRMPEWAPWELWLYRDGRFRRISSDPLLDNLRPDINDAGEIVWWWLPNGGLTPSGIRFMRRIRSGDVDFDGEVNLNDFADLPGCLTGPVDTDHLCACRFYDVDHDRDVDLADFGSFQNGFGVQLSGDCCTAHDGPGCNDPDIEACVCDLVDLCCHPAFAWDDYCVGLVETLGCGTCP